MAMDAGLLEPQRDVDTGGFHGAPVHFGVVHRVDGIVPGMDEQGGRNRPATSMSVFSSFTASARGVMFRCSISLRRTHR